MNLFYQKITHFPRLALPCRSFNEGWSKKKGQGED